MKTNDRKLWLSNIKLFCLALVGSSFAFGQSVEEESTRNSYIYNSNIFSISLSNGFNKTQFEVESGTESPRSGVGHIHKLNLAYSLSLSQNFGATFGAGLGIFPFIYRIDPMD